MAMDYERINSIIKDFLKDNRHMIKFEGEMQDHYTRFTSKFSPELLGELEGMDLVNRLFPHDNDKTTMSYELEFVYYFGGIRGGYPSSYHLYKSSKTGKWTTGSGKYSKTHSNEEVIQIATGIRDALVNGADLIMNSELDTVEDYTILGNKLKDIFRDSNVTPHHSWVHKYYSIICWDRIPDIHKDKMKKEMLKKFHIEPLRDYYANDGQLYQLLKGTDMPFYNLFDESIVGLFYDYDENVWEDFQQKHLKKDINNGNRNNRRYWAYSPGNYASKWSSYFNRNIMGIGSVKSIGSLDDYSNTEEDREKLTDLVVKEKNLKVRNRNEATVLLQFAKEIKSGDIIFAKQGNKKIVGWGIVKNTPYYYDKTLDDEYYHYRDVQWMASGEWNFRRPFKGQLALNELEDSDLKQILKLIDIDKQVLEEDYSKYKRNKIYFGAPGTGKSYKLNKDKKQLFKDNKEDYERVTFHPDYSYANFVGTYKPVATRDDNGKSDISYEYVPGPFMRVLVRAFKQPQTNHLLIIEEINRANVAAVFGDIFQLLDRLTRDDNDESGRHLGASEYDIQTSNDMRNYLKKELGPEDNKLGEHNYERIWIPENMYIYATMNSADQGVFPMDTAFKRRWDFEYIDIDNNEYEGNEYTLGLEEYMTKITWNKIRKAINKELINYANEDKLLGPYFIPQNLDQETFKDVFINKVLMYLFEDVAKSRRNEIFDLGEDEKVIYSKICRDFKTKGIYVFCENITNQLTGENVE
ncbi:MAG: AAA family ATPase [Methanosphaera sp.]|nr:AAA family ATPase [Methanosphaera sp.]